ncbi:hypothetical protein HRG_006913 [Hirsutella rhossiliensis]|uniref:Uncharacterized protein n=1 Tax=Hirsutella rhossiliensis TaxID=111463 RepID=A0A9P8SGB0_9HYPO|nr:uncharacterized protein HRG_06913 [Hirsutella rhossiliensis]KAH0961833.1 hypothetical protein HRG_06913 [Hirsutella rhossiliensis]
MSASQGDKDPRADWAKNIRREPEWKWCPKFAHGWYDFVYYDECPKCNSTEPPMKNKKKASAPVATNWHWCPTEDHGWYEGITGRGFYRVCEKCLAELTASGSGGNTAS